MSLEYGLFYLYEAVLSQDGPDVYDKQTVFILFASVSRLPFLCQLHRIGFLKDKMQRTEQLIADERCLLLLLLYTACGVLSLSVCAYLSL